MSAFADPLYVDGRVDRGPWELVRPPGSRGLVGLETLRVALRRPRLP